MSRAISLSKKSSPAVPKVKNHSKSSKKGLATSLSEQLLVALGIISLCTLLLVLKIQPWLALSLTVLLILIQLVLFLQTYFLSSMHVDLKRDTGNFKSTASNKER